METRNTTMNPTSKLILSISRRIKYSIIFLLILSVIVYFVSSSYYSKKPRFFVSKSKLFPISESNNSDNSSLLRSLSGSPASSGGEDSYYNLEELVNSRTIREVVASKIINLNGKQQYIYQQAIADFNKNPENEDSIKITDNIEQNIIMGGEALQEVLNIQTQESGFVEFSCKAYDEDFAVALANEVIDVLSTFYVKFNEKPLNSSFYALSRLKDSLEFEQNKYETAYARYLDENKFLVNQEQSLTERRLLRRITGIETALSSVSMSYFDAKSKVQDNKPIIKVLDRPRRPLDLEANKYKFYPIALAIFTFIIAFFLSNTDIFIRYLKEAMEKQRERLINPES